MTGHLSYSQISEYMRCSMYYYYHRIMGKRIPLSTAFLNGRAVHKGAEYNYDQKVESRTDLSLSTVQEVAVTAFEQEAEQIEVDWGDSNKAKEKDATAALSGIYHQHVAPAIQPVLVESEFNIVIDDGEVNILGYHDVVTELGQIRDIKTASRTPAPDEAHKSLQLTIQAMGLPAFMNDESAEYVDVALDYTVNLKTQKKAVTLASRRTKEEVEATIPFIKNVAKSIEQELFYPNPGSWMCGKTCPFWSECLGKGKLV